MRIDRDLLTNEEVLSMAPAHSARIVIAVVLALSSAAGATAMSFEERVACRRAVEDSLWTERVWPAENPGPKPALREVLSEDRLRELVRRDLAVTAALEKMWGITISSGQLQREIDRLASSTRSAEALDRIWEALGDDPARIAECLARPVLESHTARSRYAFDDAIHRGLRTRAEADLARVGARGDLHRITGIVHEEEVVIRVLDGEDAAADPASVSIETVARWLGATATRTAADLPVGTVGPLQEEADRYFAVKLAALGADGTARAAIAEWPKPSFEAWLAQAVTAPDRIAAVSGDYVLPKITGGHAGDGDSWTPVRYLPRARAGHSAVWTGTEMIVFSRRNGHIYDPVTDRWRPMDQVDAPPDGWEEVVWTGTELLVWGGGIFPDEFGGGGRYDPVSDSWQRMSDLDAPSPRTGHSAVWTGTEMIVWGGISDFTPLATGGRYDPATDSWTDTSTAGAPDGRSHHHAAWTGSEMVVWGGATASGSTSTGGRYDPVTDSWVPTSTTAAPAPRSAGRSVWTGSELIVWGGCINDACSFPPPDGARYDPTADAWTPVTTIDAPIGRWNHSATWTGSEMMVWSGCVNHDCSTYTSGGGLYDPATDSWRATSTAGNPGHRASHSAVWSGDEVIIWAGCTTGECQHALRDGGRYDPVADSWTPIDPDIPERRINHTAVWTGAEMIVWGGWNGIHLRTGGRYSPALDTWLPMSPSPGGIDARMAHTAVWSGTEMIVFGGSAPSLGTVRTGATYDPTTDSWAEIDFATAPEPRLGHAAAWTGTEMLVWGGCRFSGCTTVLGTGGLYDPGTDSWTLTDTAGAPPGRAFFPSAWTGSQLIVWGGWNGSGAIDDGGRYDPSTDSWQSVTAVDAPQARQSTPAVWTGSEMVFWGGTNGTSILPDGGRYNPASDSWLATAPGAPVAPRAWHVAEWTGSRLFLWGGCDDANACWDHRRLADGALYDPATGSWMEAGARFSPPGRMVATSIWTGEEVIVWGGDDGLDRDDGGRYAPPASGLIFGDGFESAGTGSWSAVVP